MFILSPREKVARVPARAPASLNPYGILETAAHYYFTHVLTQFLETVKSMW